jgi:hypothetical protein
MLIRSEAMKVTIEISDDDAMHINALIERTKLSESPNSHGELSIQRVGEMLMQDVAAAVRRPSSWEGANMGRVLVAHGYSF